MAKQTVEFRKKIPFDEYILALKCFMDRYHVRHVTGLCDAEILRKEMSKAELSALSEKALKDYLFVRQKDGIHIHHEIRMFLSLAANSEHVVTIQKPSYKKQKLITFFYHQGVFGATVQNVIKNSILLLADRSLDNLYREISREIHARDINKAFDLKKIRRVSEEKGLANVFSVRHEYQLFVYTAENASGKQADLPVMFNVGKREYEYLVGNLDTGVLKRYSVSFVDEHLKDYIRRACCVSTKPGQSDGEAGGCFPNNQTFLDSEPYTRYSYEKLTSEKTFPRSLGQLFKTFGKGLISSLKSRRFLWKLAAKILFMVAIAGLAAAWNLYGLCYLNDTFNINDHSFLGRATAFLFGGTLQLGVNKWGGNLYGWSALTNLTESAPIAQSVYLLAGLLLMSMFNTLISGKTVDFFRDLFRFPGRWKMYRRNLDRPVSYYFWSTVLFAAPLGLVLFNPFSVAVLAVILVLSAVKGDDSNLAVFLMICRSALSSRGVSSGKKNPPKFAAIVTRIWMSGLAFTLYSLLNLAVWKLFKYNFYSRVIFTVLLMIFALFRMGIIRIKKPGRAQKISAMLVFILAGTALITAASGALTVLADDGGWSESGRTLVGLIHNSGFDIILGFSMVLAGAAFCGALFAFGASIATAALAAGAVGGGAMIWSSATQTGKETAYDFIMGKYSPYGGDSLIAQGLDIAVGFIPYVGNAWQTFSCTRDAAYDFSNGNYVAGTAELVFAGLGAKGFSDEVSSLMNRVPSNIAADDEMFSSYKDRIDRTPNKNGSWTGERGESVFISDKTDDVGKYLDEAGIDGITYHNGQPDFTPVSKGNVNIEKMSTERLGSSGNFAQADAMMAAARGNGCTAADVANWRQMNGYTWHECNNMTTMQKVPSVINKTYTHLGGVSECRQGQKAAEDLMGLFDD